MVFLRPDRFYRIVLVHFFIVYCFPTVLKKTRATPASKWLQHRPAPTHHAHDIYKTINDGEVHYEVAFPQQLLRTMEDTRLFVATSLLHASAEQPRRARYPFFLLRVFIV